MNISFYIHIPFCKKKCGYCHFYSRELISYDIIKKNIIVYKFYKKIKEEIFFYESFLKKYFNSKSIGIDTIYFGGGTPSSINPIYIKKIIFLIKKNFYLKENVEITIEVNPQDINERILKKYKKIGINRVSIGLQSFSIRGLLFLKRDFSKILKEKNIDFRENQITKHLNLNKLKLINDNLYLFYQSKIDLIKKYFKNYSVDFILGVPGFNLLKIINFIKKNNIPHISIYMFMLTGEEKYFKYYKKNIDKIDNKSFFQYKQLQKKLNNLGYVNYEISNFALKEEYFSKHNLSYWNRSYYIGLGPTSSGFIENLRYKNNNLENYLKVNFNKNIKSLFSLDHFKEKELLNLKDQINEEIMLGLRTINGVSLNLLKEKYNFDLIEYKKNEIEKLLTEKKIIFDRENNKIFINPKFYIISNKIISDLFV